MSAMKPFALFAICLSAAAATCDSLTTLSLPNATITAAHRVEAGKIPAHCRVEGVIKPTDDSNIKFEVWLPEFGWNGKFRGLGNGGFGGSLDTNGLGAAVAAGYAAASTDTGHTGSAIEAGWALGHFE